MFNNFDREDNGWMLKEDTFSLDNIKKSESIMSLGNGYMGLRSANEDSFSDKSRFNLVSGTYDFLDGDTSNELPNNYDVTNCDIYIDGELVSPINVKDYCKTLNLKTGLLRRTYTFLTKNDKHIELEYLRVVSLKDLHLIASKINIVSSSDINVLIESGIVGDIYHSDHFKVLEKGCINDVLFFINETKQSRILFSTMSISKVEIDDKTSNNFTKKTKNENNKIIDCFKIELNKNQKLSLTKISNVFTNRDKELSNINKDSLKEKAFNHMNTVKHLSFEEIYNESKDEWNNRIWKVKDIIIDSDDDFDQLAIHFAIYHLTIMTPSFDNRMNIGAKGLTGPGYRGHIFWDTEIFILPYFIYTSPNEARSLLEYRYNSLDAAKKNAKLNGYDGAMFPWESAWITDTENTPKNYRNGREENHITADVAYAVNMYYLITKDEDFIEKYGYELIFECAKFWLSRLTYNKEKDRYEIHTVIGPDEYKWDINNNAYTNYLAHYNIELAIKYALLIKKENVELYNKYCLDEYLNDFIDRVQKIYLPIENSDGIIPEDDTYLSLLDIVENDVSLSKRKDNVLSIIDKLGGFTKVMVSKQADIVLLLYLFPDLFSEEIIEKNYYFYERRCLHSSSLSLSTYSIIAIMLNKLEEGYELFSRAIRTDLGSNMKSSDEGIHAASLGGIWQIIIFGFLGIKYKPDILMINPHLPKKWNSVKTKILWKKQLFEIEVNKNEITIYNLDCINNVTIQHKEKNYIFKDEITIKI